MASSQIRRSLCVVTCKKAVKLFFDVAENRRIPSGLQEAKSIPVNVWLQGGTEAIELGGATAASSKHFRPVLIWFSGLRLQLASSACRLSTADDVVKRISPVFNELKWLGRIVRP
jgi:hypothetical protein